jgi:hypothetical protein
VGAAAEPLWLWQPPRRSITLNYAPRHAKNLRTLCSPFAPPPPGWQKIHEWLRELKDAGALDAVSATISSSMRAAMGPRRAIAVCRAPFAAHSSTPRSRRRRRRRAMPASSCVRRTCLLPTLGQLRATLARPRLGPTAPGALPPRARCRLVSFLCDVTHAALAAEHARLCPGDDVTLARSSTALLDVVRPRAHGRVFGGGGCSRGLTLRTAQATPDTWLFLAEPASPLVIGVCTPWAAWPSR